LSNKIDCQTLHRVRIGNSFHAPRHILASPIEFALQLVYKGGSALGVSTFERLRDQGRDNRRDNPHC
jgi:hypothetical protein